MAGFVGGVVFKNTKKIKIQIQIIRNKTKHHQIRLSLPPVTAVNLLQKSEKKQPDGVTRVGSFRHGVI